MSEVRNAGSKAAMGATLAAVVQEVLAKGANADGKFVVALSGGSLPNVLREGLASAEVDWTKWHVFFADERLVPLDHKDSNYLACKEALFDKVPIPASQVYCIDPSLSPDAAAQDYAAKLKGVRDSLEFDLLLLGMGPDGHTCSLFPNHPLLAYGDAAVAPITDSPKPPAERVTLTLPVIKKAGAVVFVCGGAEKAEPLRRALKPAESEDPHVTPARIVRETAAGRVTWVVDDAAASKL